VYREHRDIAALQSTLLQLCGSGFFSWGLWLCIIALGLLPALYCLLQPVVIGTAKKLGIYCGSALAIVLAIASMNIGQTLWISQRDTNPLLSKQEGLKVYEANSCATYTTAGTKAILEPKNSDDLYELLPNYAFRTGVDVSWRTYNWGEPPIHIDEYLTD
jgi:glucan phosphoethanolaminetransferase (alkaline phosphatase superfamily)